MLQIAILARSILYTTLTQGYSHRNFHFKQKISPYIFCQKYQMDEKNALFGQLSNLLLISTKATITPAENAVE